MTRAKSILSGPSKTSARVCHLHGRIARRAEVFLTRHGNAHSTDNDCTGPNQEIIGNESRSLSVKIVLTVRIFFTAVRQQLFSWSLSMLLLKHTMGDDVQDTVSLQGCQREL